VLAPTSFKYRAFLSYSHRDKSWGEWLHTALESYRVDKDLVGRPTAAGPVPKGLRPIFRDRDDFAAGHSLTDQTLAALEAAQFLVVVCSPNAAASKYVNEEIRRFKTMGGGERVVAIIVDGEPGDPARECFPPALRCKVGPDGEVTDEPEEPIAADARPQGDGKRLALQKVVAALIAVPFDDVRKREAIGDSRRIKIAAAAIAVVAALVLFAGYLFIEHQSQQKELADFRALAEKLVAANTAQAAPAQGQAVAEAVNAAAKGAQEGDGRLKRALELLKQNKVAEATALFQAVADDKAARIQQDSKDAAAAYRNLGAIAGLADPKRALDAYTKAVELDPDDLNSLLWVGLLHLERGYLAEAEMRFRRLLSVATASDSERYWASLGVGDIRKARGDLAAAAAEYRQAGAIAERVTSADPSNTDWQRDLSVSYNRIGDVLMDQGNLPEALKSFRAAFAVAERLAKAAPNNTLWQQDLSISNERLGDVYFKQGNLHETLEQYRASLNRMVPIRDADPSNMALQRFTSVTLNKIGDVQVAQGNLPEALKSFRDEFVIAERLAKADPSNAEWQRDLSVSNERLGDVYLAQGNLPEALEQYRASLDRMVPIRDADPSNMELQRFTSVTLNKIGGVQVAQGNLPEALKSFRASLALRERLAKADPNNAGWQRDLSVSYNKVGDVLVAQDNLPEALKSYRDGLAIAERLAQADPYNAGWQRDLSISYEKVGDVLKAQGNLPEALESFRDGLAIRERLARADPNNAEWQRDLSVSYERVGDMLVAQGNLPEALKSFRDSLGIRERLAKADATNVGWQVDVLWAHWRLAQNGDDSARRWTLIVVTLRRLKQDNKLTAEQARWLPVAEEELAKLKPQ
jgi:tetratricopeptide (TPR) repeat protein